MKKDVGIEMPLLIKWADLGITASGSTIMEMCFLSLPTFAISIASNQDPVWDLIVKKQLAVGFDQTSLYNGKFKKLLWSVIHDEVQRVEFSNNMKRLGVGDSSHEVESKIIHEIELEFIEKSFLKKNINTFCSMIKDFKYFIWKEENFLMDLPGKWDYSLVARNKGKIVGFSINSLKKNNVVYVHFIFVVELYKKKRIGTNLVKSLIAKARRNGINSVRLRCPTENKPAVNFYKSNGFEIQDTVFDELSKPYTDYLFSMKLWNNDY